VVTFKPLRSRQGWYGLLVGLALLAVDGVLLSVVLRRPTDGLSFVVVLLMLFSLPLLLYLAFRLSGCFNLRYLVDRNGVTIVWGAMRQAVAMGRIERIVKGGTAQRRLAWWPWPGLHAGVGGESDLGPYFSLATRPPAQQLLLVTPEKVYGISPAEPERFLEALQERNMLGPAHTLPAEPQWPLLWSWRFWHDWLGQALLLAGLALVLVLFGFLAFRFPSLPPEIPLHFDALGRPDRVGPPQGLFLLPLIGLLAWSINTVWGGVIYRRQRLAAYLLWGGAVAVQIIAGAALASLIR